MEVPSSWCCFDNVRIFFVLISILNFGWPRLGPHTQVNVLESSSVSRVPSQDRTSAKAHVCCFLLQLY